MASQMGSLAIDRSDLICPLPLVAELMTLAAPSESPTAVMDDADRPLANMTAAAMARVPKSSTAVTERDGAEQSRSASVAAPLARARRMSSGHGSDNHDAKMWRGSSAAKA